MSDFAHPLVGLAEEALANALAVFGDIGLSAGLVNGFDIRQIIRQII